MSVRRTLAVGWFDNAPFRAICARYQNRIKEVFFAWPGVLASRPMDPWTDERRAGIVADLRWARANGIELDAIFNANCYGDIAMTETLADHVLGKLDEMAAEGLFPEHLTTASPFIATIVKRRHPQIKIRFSINMFISSTLSLEYVDDICDAFYADRAHQRSLAYMERMAAWAQEHGKMMGMYVNSGCLRDCPFHTFHDNLHGHDRTGQSAAAQKFNFSNFLCRTVFERGDYEQFLRGLWIRPEELPRYEPYVGVVKLATRRHPDPEAVIRAYATYSYDGDLAEIMDPCYKFPGTMDNAALGASPFWPEVRDCPDAGNCRHCGKCAALLKDVLRPRSQLVDLSAEFQNFFKG